MTDESKQDGVRLPNKSEDWHAGYHQGLAEALADMSVQVIDVQAHCGLPKAIHGAIVSTIDAHGPLTRTSASSATKRVLAAIKVHNRRLRAEVDDSPS